MTKQQAETWGAVPGCGNLACKALDEVKTWGVRAIFLGDERTTQLEKGQRSFG